MAILKLDKIKSRLSVDTISLRCGVITIRRGFFYRHGMTAEKLAERVERVYPNASILDKGEVWKPFRGGASVANQSHWFVKFTFPRI